MKTQSKFKIVGLNKSNSGNIYATCEPLNKEETFHSEIKVDKDRKEAMFNYCKNNWSDKKIANIEHDGLNKSGIPINPMLISIEEL